jgi:hypothetical protein
LVKGQDEWLAMWYTRVLDQVGGRSPDADSGIHLDSFNTVVLGEAHGERESLW